MIFFEKVMLFFEPTAVAVVLVYAYGYLNRALGQTRQLNIAMGFIFGAAAAAAMSSPIPIADGMIIDMRCLFVGLAAAHFGVTGGAIALAIAGLTRLGIGGSGVMLGLVGMSMSYLLGFAWTIFVKPHLGDHTKSYAVLGCMISGQLVVGLLLPQSVQGVFFATLAPVIIVANLVGAILLSKLIKHENRRLAETERLRLAALIDPLTQVLNRDGLLKRFSALSASRNPKMGMAMLCIDFDGFKHVNDTHGHLAGDQVLVEVARRIAACLRPDDLLARISGDEFIIMLNDLKADQAKAVANRCRVCVAAKPVTAEGAKIDITISIGGSWTTLRPDFDDLRAVADDALYNAKSRGRNCVVFDGSESGGLENLDASASAA